MVAGDPVLDDDLARDEPLASALWFAAYQGSPTEGGYYDHRPAIFVAVAQPQFRAELRDLLADPKRLSLEAGVDDE